MPGLECSGPKKLLLVYIRTLRDRLRLGEIALKRDAKDGRPFFSSIQPTVELR